MEKIKPQQNIGPERKEQRILLSEKGGKNPKYEQEKEWNPADLRKKRGRSVFGKSKLLEKIKEALDISQKKNEWPDEELKETTKILKEEDLDYDISLLEKALRQDDNESM